MRTVKEAWSSYHKIRNEITKEISEAHKAYQEKYLIVTPTLVKNFGDILGVYIRTILELPR